MNTEILEDIGLSKSEIKAYITSLEIGSAMNGEIAQKAKLNRSNCNEALKRLVEKGLMSYVIKSNRKYYEANNPKNILKFLRDKEEKVEKILPKLEEKQRLPRKQQEANIYEGYKGIRTIFEEVLETLKKGDEYLVFSAVQVPKFFDAYFDNWSARMIKKGIKRKIIFHPDYKAGIRKRKQDRLTEVKILQKEHITPAVVNIFGDKTATIVWTAEPIAFVVKNKEYTDSFRHYFNLLWKVAKKA